MRAFVLVPFLKNTKAPRSAPSRLEEIKGLCKALDLEIAGSDIVPLDKVRAATFIGQGKCDELKGLLSEKEIDLLVFDGNLTPSQQRNLERSWKNVQVIDRTWLILEIFAKRARTREARLQVELARLIYQKSHLVRSWTHLERQRAGGGFLGGAGETQLELDRRRLDERIIRLEKQLKTVERTRGLHRKARQEVPYPVIALVGYTNAGKSTLFNTLTGESVLAQDLLFATLDPTMRLIKLPSGRKVILSDTVGFISDLPISLIAAFRATLEEVLTAHIIFHVEDRAHKEVAIQRDDVIKTLDSLGINHDHQHIIYVYNKMDQLAEEERERAEQEAREEKQPTFCISALNNQGLGPLLSYCDELLRHEDELFELTLSADKAGPALAWLYKNGEVKKIISHEEGSQQVYVILAPAKKAQFEKIFL